MGILEDLFGSPDEDAKAEKALLESMGQFDGLRAPDLGPVSFDKYDYLGDYKPTQFAVAEGVDSPEKFDISQSNFNRLDGTSFDNIQGDPRLQDAQMGALASLQELASNGGLNASDRARLSQSQTDVNAADRGRRDAIMQNMSARGMGGTSAELLAQLQSAQGATNQQSQTSMDVNAMAQERAMQSLMNQGQMAGQIRGQNYGENSAQAQARDAINQFNSQFGVQNNQFNATASNRGNEFQSGQALDAGKFTAGAKNAANSQNVGMAFNAGMAGNQARQNIAGANTDLLNKQTMTNNVELPTQNFQNTMGLATGKSNAAGQGVDYWTNRGNRTAGTKAALASGALQLGGAALMGGKK